MLYTSSIFGTAERHVWLPRRVLRAVSRILAPWPISASWQTSRSSSPGFKRTWAQLHLVLLPLLSLSVTTRFNMTTPVRQSGRKVVFTRDSADRMDEAPKCPPPNSQDDQKASTLREINQQWEEHQPHFHAGQRSQRDHQVHMEEILTQKCGHTNHFHKSDLELDSRDPDKGDLCHY